MQNTVQSTSKLYLADEIVYIADYSTSMTNDSLNSLTGASWVNLGALTEFSREANIEAVTPPSQNVEHETVINRMAETINLTIQELLQSNYNKLLGGSGQAQTVAGSSTNTSVTYAAGVVSTAVEKFYKFPQQNYSSTGVAVPGSVVISGSSTYVAGVSYEVIQDSNGDFGFFITSTGAHTSTSALVVAITYAPKAQEILWHGGADSLTPFMLKVYSVYSDGRAITAYYPYVNYVSGGAVTDKNIGEFKDIAFTVEAKEHPTFLYNSRKQFRIDIQST